MVTLVIIVIVKIPRRARERMKRDRGGLLVVLRYIITTFVDLVIHTYIYIYICIYRQREIYIYVYMY